MNWPLFCGHDTKNKKVPNLKVRTKKIKLPKRLLLRNPNPRLLYNDLLSLSPYSAFDDVPEYDSERSNHILTWRLRRATIDGGSWLMEESS